MRRRDFITLLGGAAAAWPLAARAQQRERMRLIGVTMGLAESDPEVQARLALVLRVQRERGWVEGHNLRIVYRSSNGVALDRIRALAGEVIALNPDAILANNTPFVQELQRQTRTIPIVFAGLGDPVETGVVTALGRPGGNATGFMNFEPVIGGKWLELLKEIAPTVNRVLVLADAGNVADANLSRMAEAAALAMGVRLTTAAVRRADEIETAVTAIAADPNAGLVVMTGGFLASHRGLIIALANRHRLPAVYPYRYFATNGGLMFFGADTTAMWGQAAAYADRILRGEKPGDLPVQAPVKYELVVNLKTAKAIGLTIPEAFLLRADEVIE